MAPRGLDVVAERTEHADAGDHHPPATVAVLHRHIPSPPSTSSTSPVMNEASSEQRNRTARATSCRLAEAAERGVLEHRLRLLGKHLGQPRLDVTGSDDVGAHAAGTELAGERLGEADHPGLRRRIVRLAPVAVQADDRADVDDRAGSFLHHRPRHGAAGVEDRAQIGLDHLAPVLVGHPRKQAVTRQAGVVDEDVDVARPPRRAAPPARATRRRPALRGAPSSDASAFGLVGAGAVAEDHRGARRRELTRDRGPDAARCPGDERRLARERAERASQPSSWTAAFSDWRSLTGIARTELSILFSKPLSTFPGPTSTNVVDAVADQLARRLGELDGRSQLLDEQRAIPLHLLELRRDGGHEPRRRNLEVDLVDRRPEPFRSVCDERRVERTRHAQTDRAARALALRLRAALVDRGCLARDDELAGAVVVRGPHVVDLACRAPRPPRPRDRESPPSSPGAPSQPRPSRGRARARARSPRRRRSTRPRRAPRTRRRNVRRRSRGRCRARGAPR